MKFSLLAEKSFSCSAIFNKKELAVVSNLKFISKTNIMVSRVELGKRFITSGPGIQIFNIQSAALMKFQAPTQGIQSHYTDKGIASIPPGSINI